MTIKLQTGIPSPTTDTPDNPDNMDAIEKTILTDIESKSISPDTSDKPNITPPVTLDKPAGVSAETAIVMIRVLFNGLSRTINPVWALKPDEEKSIAETMKAAYPMIDLGAWAKAFFWINLTIIVVPRALVTTQEMFSKNKKKVMDTPNE